MHTHTFSRLIFRLVFSAALMLYSVVNTGDSVGHLELLLVQSCLLMVALPGQGWTGSLFKNVICSVIALTCGCCQDFREVNRSRVPWILSGQRFQFLPKNTTDHISLFYPQTGCCLRPQRMLTLWPLKPGSPMAPEGPGKPGSPFHPWKR